MRHLLVVTRPSRSFTLVAAAALLLLAAQPGDASAQPPLRGNRLELRRYAQEIMMHAMGHLGGLQRCQQQSTVDPEVLGQRIRSVTIVVRPDGRIGELSAAPRSLVPATLRSCVLAIARNWPLSPPRDGTRPLRLVYTRGQIQSVLGGP